MSKDVNFAEDYKIILWGKGQKNVNPIPKIIWTFWDSHMQSPLVEICFHQIRKLLPDHQFNIVNRENVHQYLENFCKPRNDISFVNYTDLARLKLLEKYGGFYMDASLFLTENLNWIYKIKEQQKSDLVGFYSDHFTLDYDFPLLEMWFLAVPAKNKFIKEWAVEFEKCYHSENPHQYFETDKKNPLFLQKIDENLSHYLIAYLAASKIMRNNEEFRIIMISANDTAHYYNFKLNLLPHRLAEIFLFNKKEQNFPKLIKFEKRGRNDMDEAINRAQYSKKSLLFRIADEKNYYAKKIPRLANYIKFILSNFKKKYFQ